MQKKREQVARVGDKTTKDMTWMCNSGNILSQVVCGAAETYT